MKNTIDLQTGKRLSICFSWMGTNMSKKLDCQKITFFSVCRQRSLASAISFESGTRLSFFLAFFIWSAMNSCLWDLKKITLNHVQINSNKLIRIKSSDLNFQQKTQISDPIPSHPIPSDPIRSHPITIINLIKPNQT